VNKIHNYNYLPKNPGKICDIGSFSGKYLRLNFIKYKQILKLAGLLLNPMESRRNLLLFKYGGNAMTDPDLQSEILKNICLLKKKGHSIVIVHGGGPFIKLTLDEAGIESEFIDGQRKTTSAAMKYVEMALKGRVNGSLVSIINGMGYKAVGLSGKDGQMVLAEKRLHQRKENGKSIMVDLGQVGDVVEVDPALIDLLLDNDYLPVLTCIASDRGGTDYNINADLFAGHIAGNLSARQYVVLTDVDGLMLDKNDPGSLIREIQLSELEKLKENGVIQGGMIPKVDSCRTALENGAGSARIINGTVPGQIAEIFEGKDPGTVIRK
jgi:acetylglutamate kinase